MLNVEELKWWMNPVCVPQSLSPRAAGPSCQSDAQGWHFGGATKALSAPTHLDVHHVAAGLVFGLEFLRLHYDQLPWGDFQELCYFSAESVVEFIIFSQIVSSILV